MGQMKRVIISKLPIPLFARILRIKNFFKCYFAKRSNVGKRSYVDPSVHVCGWHNVRIGKYSSIGQDTWINVNYRAKDKISIIIGDNCKIGRRNFFTSGELIRLGDYCASSIDCRFLGAEHIYSSPFKIYISADVTQGGHIDIGPNCFLGAGVTILKGVKMGYGCVIGAATVVNCDIPPLSLVVGNPCKVIKRFDVKLRRWVKAEEYNKEHDQYLMSEEEYLEGLKREPQNKSPRLLSSSKIFGDF